MCRKLNFENQSIIKGDIYKIVNQCQIFCLSTLDQVKGPGGVNASIMSFGGTGSHKYVMVRLIEISTRFTHNMDITPLE